MSLAQIFARKQFAPSAGAPELTIRDATLADAEAVARVAELDSRPAPRGQVLVAEVGGEIWSAVSVEDLHAVADPFRPSGELTWLLLERARRLRRAQRGRPRSLPRLRPAVG